MIAAADREEASAWPSGRNMELQSHLHGDLDRDRARVGEKHMLERGFTIGCGPRSQVDEPPSQLDPRFMGEPAEHHVRHPTELSPRGGVELGHGIPMDRAPPRGHGVDALAGLAAWESQPQPHARRRLDEVGLGRGERGGVGVPDVVAVVGEQPLETRVAHAGAHVLRVVSPCSTQRAVQSDGVTWTTIRRRHVGQ